jgi:dihydrofolate reductase
LKEFSLIDRQVFIIGGEQIYRFFLPMLDDIVVTHVPDSYEGDTYFPDYKHLFPKSEIILEQEDFIIKRHFK